LLGLDTATQMPSKRPALSSNGPPLLLALMIASVCAIAKRYSGSDTFCKRFRETVLKRE
jgi:hypothetical protein